MGAPTQLVKVVVGRGGSASLRLRLCCNPLGEPLPTRLRLCTGIRQVNRLTYPTIRLIRLIREQTMRLNSRVQLYLATAMCIFGCALLVAGLALPPAGIIDSSLLVAYGETLTFAGSLIGIDYHYRYRK